MADHTPARRLNTVPFRIRLGVTGHRNLSADQKEKLAKSLRGFLSGGFRGLAGARAAKLRARFAETPVT
jgi:hypothetical protein